RFFSHAAAGTRDFHVTGVQTCALPISAGPARAPRAGPGGLPGARGPPHGDVERVLLAGAPGLVAVFGHHLVGPRVVDAHAPGHEVGRAAGRGRVGGGGDGGAVGVARVQ